MLVVWVGGAEGGEDVGGAVLAGDLFGEAFAQDGAFDDAGAVAAGEAVEALVELAPPGGAVEGQRGGAAPDVFQVEMGEGLVAAADAAAEVVADPGRGQAVL